MPKHINTAVELPEPRQPITSEIQQIIIKEFSSVPVYHGFDALAATNRIKGITDDTPMSMQFFRNFV